MKTLVIEIFERGTNYRKGNLTLNGRNIATTLEPMDMYITTDTKPEIIKQLKQNKKIAIPYGTYEIEMYCSDKFHRIVPRLMNVPGFEAIEIHQGNELKDTEGCILLGLVSEFRKPEVKMSLSACRILNNYLCTPTNEKIELTIKPKDPNDINNSKGINRSNSTGNN